VHRSVVLLSRMEKGEPLAHLTLVCFLESPQWVEAQ